VKNKGGWNWRSKVPRRNSDDGRDNNCLEIRTSRNMKNLTVQANVKASKDDDNKITKGG
jgi:hypothetical protein